MTWQYARLAYGRCCVCAAIALVHFGVDAVVSGILPSYCLQWVV